VLIINNYNLWVFNDEITKLLYSIPTAKFLIEDIPSEVILTQIFNGKIKFGNLTISISKPSVVISPYYVTKTLKEWDLIIHNEKIFSDSIVLTNTENICEEKEIGINIYDISSKLFQKKLIAECGVDHKVNFIQHKIRGPTKVSVMYKSEAEKKGYKYLNLNITVDFYISLFKNASNVEVEVYEKMRELLKQLNPKLSA